ncbi:hypothetical protein AAEH85_21495, partial [Shewanella algae]|uniref:hypothetical protein n=1 Tax=Shewanella algae TaxID=38313 RepID=UPI00313C380F
QVVAALEMARSMPLSTRGGVGASQIVPDLVMRIDHLLNGDPLWRGCNRNPPPCFVAPTTLDKYVLEAAKYVCGLPSDETFMRGVEEIAPNPV